MAATDPFSLVYNALWTLLEAHAEFAALVKVGNRIKFNAAGGDDPIKDKLSSADLPEVRLLCTGTSPHVQHTSGSSSCIKFFEIQVATRSQQYTAELFPVEWEIYRAMSKWATVLSALTWNSKTFVKLARPTDGQQGVSTDDVDRGGHGWVSVWGIEVQMWFTTTDLQAVAE